MLGKRDGLEVEVGESGSGWLEVWGCKQMGHSWERSEQLVHVKWLYFRRNIEKLMLRSNLTYFRTFVLNSKD